MLSFDFFLTSLKEPVQSTSKEMPGYLMDKIDEDEINEYRVFDEFELEIDTSEDEAQFHGFQTIPSSEDNLSNAGGEASSKSRRRISSSESEDVAQFHGFQTPTPKVTKKF